MLAPTPLEKQLQACLDDIRGKQEPNMQDIKEKRVWEQNDAVVCVDDTASFNRLTKGGKYMVTLIDGYPVVMAGGSPHNIDRFELVEATAS